MFFINTRRKLTSNTFILHLLPAGTVLITVLGLTLLGWRNAREAYTAERQASINLMVDDTKGSLVDRLSTYELMLRGASGLFISSDEITRLEWQNFVESFDIQLNYPGIQGVGYAQSVTRNDISSLLSDAKRDKREDFRIFPEGDRPEYVVLKFFEPENPRGIGFDMYSEPIRKQTIETAKRTGESAITGKLSFVRSEESLGTIGFSMYLPVYINRTQQNLSPDVRQTQGYVFAPFAVDNFFSQALDEQVQDEHGLRIYDTKANEENLLFKSNTFDTLDEDSSLSHTMPIELFGREWILDFRFSPDIVDQTTRNRPMSSLVIGTMLSFLLSGFVLTLLVARTRVLSHAKQLEVQSAKDELLSLASHQLRTPATSVKQYLGMAVEGFAGKLSPQQQNLIEKAYESNERQLHIINEILYVAKIDAKGIVITPRQINLSKLLKELTQELTSDAKKNQQKIRLNVPKKPIKIEADEYCLRMAIENLISNALKYSYKGTTTSVKLTSTKNSSRITIRDRGVGIEQEDIALLFHRFSRIPNELTKQTSGSGIGLYLSQQLIKLHNGTIDVTSEKGKGTTFIVTIPNKYQPSELDAAQDRV